MADEKNIRLTEREAELILNWFVENHFKSGLDKENFILARKLYEFGEIPIPLWFEEDEKNVP